MNNFPIILFISSVCYVAFAEEKCLATCPQDCGMTRDENGCAICHCDVNPFFKPSPPSPSPSTKTNAGVLQRGEICRVKCPQDCGCTVDVKNEATCHCSIENHPLIPPTRPPGFQCMPPQCETPCFLHNDGTKICPVCKCPEE